MNVIALKEVVHYDAESGVFTWVKPSSTRSRIVIGAKAGKVLSNGYVQLCIFGKRYAAHRLAWLYMTGSFPKNMIDHRDMVKSNNSFSNLRECTRSQNNHNCEKRKTNKSGFKGVSWDKTTEKWVAALRYKGKMKRLGYFKSKTDAFLAYDNFARIAHGEFYRQQCQT